jgi:molecular chaperone GrpE
MMDDEIRDNSVPAAGPPAPADSERRDRAHVRDRILRRFELWLDEILDGEQPPEGIAAEILEQLETDVPAEAVGTEEAGCDSYALWSAVTAMAEETRLQGRAFKQLHDSLTPMQEMVGSVGAMLQRYEAALDRQEQEIEQAARQAAWSDILAVLIDMRDRLLRGAQAAEAWLRRPRSESESRPKTGLRALFGGGHADDGRTRQQDEAVQSMLTGYNLCREVLDEALANIGVRPIECLGRPFDPLTMKAVDIGYESDAPDGGVLEVYREGYRQGETVYRPAEVKVARQRPDAPRNAGEAPDSAFSQGGQHES